MKSLILILGLFFAFSAYPPTDSQDGLSFGETLLLNSIKWEMEKQSDNAKTITGFVENHLARETEEGIWPPPPPAPCPPASYNCRIASAIFYEGMDFSNFLNTQTTLQISIAGNGGNVDFSLSETNPNISGDELEAFNGKVNIRFQIHHAEAGDFVVKQQLTLE